MKIFFFLFLLFFQDNSWWENFKSFEEKFKKISADFQDEYERVKKIEEIKEKREKREKKITSEYQKKAIEEVVKFLRDEIGNKKGAEFIENKYKNGSIVWGEEDSYFFGKTTLDTNHLYNLYDENLNIKYDGLIYLTAIIIHESIHSGQWGAYFGMTSNANEEEAYFGTLSSIALWMQEMEKKVQDENIKDPCTKKQKAENLKNILNLLFYYDSIIYEKSNEAREKIKEKKEKTSMQLQMIYEMKAKAQNNLNWLDIYQDNIERELKKEILGKEEKNYLYQNHKKIREERIKWQGHLKKIEEAIKVREGKLKTYEAQLNEPQLDITKFQWTDEKGNKYSRDKLLKTAREKQKNLVKLEESLKNECEKKLAEEKDKKVSEPQKLPKENIKDKREEILSCLCRCGVPMGVWGGYFPDPLPNTSPVCEKPGICAAGNWGCYRFYPPLEGDCFDSCFNSKGTSKEEVKKEVLLVIQKDFNALISGARKIMEEYLENPKGSMNLLKARDYYAFKFQNYLSDSKVVYSIKSESPYLKKIKEKNKNKDPEKALTMVKEAEEIKNSCRFINASQLVNLRVEFAIILAKAALKILPELEFNEGIYMLDKALDFYQEEKNPRVKEIKELKKSFLKWKDAWETLKNEAPICLDFLKNKKICACEELYSKKILPSINLLNIYTFASANKWEIMSASGAALKIPEKEKIEKELRESMEKAKRECEKNPLFKTKDYQDLKNYYSYKIYESSNYTNKENLKKYAANPICDINALKIAEKILSNSDLCDCQKREIEEVLKIAKRDAKPMEVYFDANPKEVKLNERVIIELKIKGGRPPYNNVLKGSLNLNMEKDPSPGFVYNWLAEREGTHYFDITVKDSCGEVFQKEVSIYVRKKEVGKPEKIAEKTEEKKKTDLKDKVEIRKEEKEKKPESEVIEKKKDKTEKTPSFLDLNGKWTVNCGDEDMEAIIIQKENQMEIKIEDSYYKGTLRGDIINLKSLDGKEEITGNLINERELRIKIIDRELEGGVHFSCNFKRKRF